MSGTSAPVGFDARDQAGTTTIGGGTLPDWAPYSVAAGAALVVAAVLLITTAFTLVLMVIATAIVSSAAIYVLSRTMESARQAKNRLMTVSIASAFVLAILPLLSLLYTVISKGLARFDSSFFTESARNVVGAGGGAIHALWGTLIISALAAAISVPIGVMGAIYLQEYGRGRLSRALTFFVDVMTGIPSIVAGLFAYALFALILGPGIRLGVIGSVALSVLMIPIVIRSTEEMLKIVPDHLREAAYALGTPKWKTITKIVLPTALAGIITGVMLALARIIGETAPLLVTTGVIDSTNLDPFNGRMQNLAVYAFNEYKSPGIPPEASIDRAWTAALTLILLVMVLNLIARVIYRRFGTEIR